MHCPRCNAELAMQDVFTKGRHATVLSCGRCQGMWMRHSDLERLSEVVDPVLAERLAIAPRSETVGLGCPQCEGHPEMRRFRSSRDERVLVDGCETCGGVWLDGGELRAIQQESLPALAAGFLGLARPVAS